MTFLKTKLLRRQVRSEHSCKQTAWAFLRIACSEDATDGEIRRAWKKHMRAIDDHERRAA